MPLGTEVLAITLIKYGDYPHLSDEDIAAARQRLSNAFQAAWIEECARLRNADGRAA
jgi:hypothetical protein